MHVDILSAILSAFRVMSKVFNITLTIFEIQDYIDAEDLTPELNLKYKMALKYIIDNYISTFSNEIELYIKVCVQEL